MKRLLLFFWNVLKWLIRFARNVIFVTVILLIMLVIFKDGIIKYTVTKAAPDVVGAYVQMDKFSWSIRKHSVRVEGFKMHNPEGFPEDDVILDVPEISVDYDLPALLNKELHFPLVVVNLREIVIIKNKEGKLNFKSLKFLKKDEEEKAAKPSEAMPLQIDELRLTVRKAIYKDYTKGEEPSIKIYDTKIEEKTYKNITSIQQLVNLIVADQVKKFGEEVVKTVATAAIAVPVISAPLLPLIGVIHILTKDGIATADVNSRLDYETIYKACLDTINELGKATKEDKEGGKIIGKVGEMGLDDVGLGPIKPGKWIGKIGVKDFTLGNILKTSGPAVEIEIEKKMEEEKFVIKVTASKAMVPMPKTAEKLLYDITEKLKKER